MSGYSGRMSTSPQGLSLERPPLAPEDAGRLASAGAPEWHPSGQRVVYAVTTFAGDRAQSRLFEAGEGLAPRPLTHEGISHSPVWAPDGHALAFLGTRGDEAGLYLLDARGGEAERVAHLPGTPRSVVWAPDCRHVAVEVLAPAEPSPSPRVVRRLRYDLNGAGFLGDRVWQVQVVDAATGAVAVVGPPDRHHFHPSWSPGGGRLVLVTSQRPDWDLEWVWDVYAVEWPQDRWTRLSAADGVSLMPVFSRSGRQVVFFHNHSATTSSTADYHLQVVDSAGGDGVRCLTHAVDRGATQGMVPARGSAARELPDGRWLWQASAGGQQWLMATALEGETTPVVKHLASASLSPDGTRVAGLTLEASRPPEVAVASLAAGTSATLTDLNPWLRDRRLPPPPQVVALPSPAGPVESVVWEPPTPASGPRPLLVHFHGGPHGAVGPYFSFAELMLASQGYLVAAPNFRGSAGWGQAFADLLGANWGAQEGEDGMALIRHLVRTGVADPSRVGAYGGSYGGFMTNWMITHYPSEIQAAVTMSTMSDLATLAYTTDHWESLQTDMGGEPWERPGHYRAHSPLALVNRIEAPLLILHGEEDHTCPLTEAEMLFVALRRLRKPVEWVRYPGEAHGFLRGGRPSTRIDAHRRLLEWFDRWLLGPSGPGGDEVPLVSAGER